MRFYGKNGEEEGKKKKKEGGGKWEDYERDIFEMPHM